ncbi:hypothetical protein FPQ18DRAFT_307954 [Pyronema domesticum]|nr:hypothetical protein FPQ18DRAFT_307954 [Pyronema domesticum]
MDKTNDHSNWRNKNRKEHYTIASCMQQDDESLDCVPYPPLQQRTQSPEMPSLHQQGSRVPLAVTNRCNIDPALDVPRASKAASTATVPVSALFSALLFPPFDENKDDNGMMDDWPDLSFSTPIPSASFVATDADVFDANGALGDVLEASMDDVKIPTGVASDDMAAFVEDGRVFGSFSDFDN